MLHRYKGKIILARIQTRKLKKVASRNILFGLKQNKHKSFFGCFDEKLIHYYMFGRHIQNPERFVWMLAVQ
jgi:hypothetical protein